MATPGPYEALSRRMTKLLDELESLLS